MSPSVRLDSVTRDLISAASSQRSWFLFLYAPLSGVSPQPYTPQGNMRLKFQRWLSAYQACDLLDQPSLSSGPRHDEQLDDFAYRRFTIQHVSGQTFEMSGICVWMTLTNPLACHKNDIVSSSLMMKLFNIYYFFWLFNYFNFFFLFPYFFAFSFVGFLWFLARNLQNVWRQLKRCRMTKQHSRLPVAHLALFDSLGHFKWLWVDCIMVEWWKL